MRRGRGISGAGAHLDRMKELPMSELAKKECVPCKGGVPPLRGREITDLLGQVEGWEAVREHHLSKNFTFRTEQQGHHPDLYLTWGKVRVETWTHKIDGLTESDFILAAKCDEALGAA
jgi:4a-hydroxytetrahydrobiopterin dehydratase